MAPYFQDYDPSEDEKQSQDPANFNLTGASPSVDSSGNTSRATGQNKQDTGSGFQNLDKYLSTNQAQDFGGQVLGKVQSAVDTAQTNQTDSANAFKTKVDTTNALPTSDQVNQAIADPTHADATTFQNWINQSYNGPKSLTEDANDYSKFNSGTNQAITQSQQLGSEPGRFSLLDSYFGKPTYNFGQKSLDNLLIQQSGLGAQTQAVQNQAQQLQSTGQQTQQDLAGYAAQRAGTVEQSTNAARAAVGLDASGNVIGYDPNTGTEDVTNAGALGKSYADVLSGLNTANTARTADQNAIATALKSGTLTAAQAQSLGLTNGQNLYNLDLTSYLTPGAALTKDQTMTSDQRAYIQALSQLAGVTDTFAGNAPIDPTSAYTFDANKAIATDAAAAQAKYNSQINQSKQTLVGLVGQDVGKGYPAASASPQEWYSYFRNYLNKVDSGQPVFRMGGESQIRQAVSQYENANNTYNPGRTLSVSG